MKTRTPTRIQDLPKMMAEEGNAGCMRLAMSLVLVILTLPLTAAWRLLGRARRGTEARLSRRINPAPGAGDRIRLGVDLDAPLEREAETRRLFVEASIRIAEDLEDGQSVFHLLYRERGADETSLIPIGPRIQNLGERLINTLGRTSLENRSVFCLCAGREVAIGSVIDPMSFDPEDGDCIDTLSALPDIRWFAATSYLRRSVSIVQRLVVIAPSETAATLEQRMNSLEKRLAAPR